MRKLILIIIFSSIFFSGCSDTFVLSAWFPTEDNSTIYYNGTALYNGFELCNTNTCNGSGGGGNTSTINNYYNITAEANITLTNSTITSVNDSFTTIQSYYNIKETYVTIEDLNSTRTQIYTNDTIKGESTICIDTLSDGNVTFIGAC